MLFDQKPKFIRPALYYGRSLGGCSGHFSEKVISKSEDIITLIPVLLDFLESIKKALQFDLNLKVNSQLFFFFS